ncbi:MULTISPECIES: carbohydrate ABC transporter permease [Paraburkholderia]|uniref:Sugar ABC transporter permease n=4 Tax=Paraburkholderia hospita TaxID=169430 RepID=A0AAJ4SZ63_9BURK|nr:sugar ABC transporter permease [Paraburkholderia hospita]EUC17135.1 ABC-type transporter, integral membrane subunit [Burkholderia sp. BT03]SKC69761.1 sorbitol ABC transporter membrane protein /mannitol ABC transporter membrane protein [Burkholderia sp. CF099]SOE56715.1 sorbitol ABC transporter membrane protein /mannitol ABC transporter membrane protein [Burkholderia sp. YR290]AXE97487.1 sugar ABC transporter permease [Paraburkholderia hospita]
MRQHLRLPLMHAHPQTEHEREERKAAHARWLVMPSVGVLVLWMAIPLAMTIWFSFSRYNLLNPDVKGFAGLENYKFLASDPSFGPSILHTMQLIISVLVITVVGGVLLSVLFDRKFYGQGVARLLAIAPFFVMPTVSALIWKNMILHPVYGLIAQGMRALGMTPIDWFADYPLIAVIIIVAWQWLPFAFLILFTAIQSLDQEQKEAAKIDGAGPFAMFFFITLPHLRRAIAVVVMMETIFLLSIFAEIYTTTGGGPGNATTNLSYLIYALGLQQFDVGLASAGGILAVVLANIVSFFLVRMLAKNLKGEYEK